MNMPRYNSNINTSRRNARITAAAKYAPAVAAAINAISKASGASLRAKLPDLNAAATSIQRMYRQYKSSKPSRSSTVTVSAGPVASVQNTVVMKGNPGAVSNSTSITASEIVGTVTWEPAKPSTHAYTYSSSGAYECVPINPIYWSTTRVANAMRSYGKWRVRSACLEFVPTLGNNWTGMVHMAGIPEQSNISSTLNPEQLASCLSTLPTYRAYPIQSVGLSSAKRSLAVTGLGWNTTRHPDDVCSFFMLAVTDLSGPDGTPTFTTSVGKLMLHYTVELSDPVPPWNLVSGVTTFGVAANSVGYNFVTDTGPLASGDVYSSLQPDHWRVARGWSASADTLSTPNTSWGYMCSGSSYAYTSATMGGFIPYLGQHLAAIALGKTQQTIVASPEQKEYIANIKVSDVVSGLDITTVLESAYFNYKVPATVGGWYAIANVYYACVLPATRAMPGDIDIPFTQSSFLSAGPVVTTGSVESGTQKEAEVIVATTTTTDPNATVISTEAQPRVARSMLRLDPPLPAIRK